MKYDALLAGFYGDNVHMHSLLRRGTMTRHICPTIWMSYSLMYSICEGREQNTKIDIHYVSWQQQYGTFPKLQFFPPLMRWMVSFMAYLFLRIIKYSHDAEVLCFITSRFATMTSDFHPMCFWLLPSRLSRRIVSVSSIWFECDHMLYQCHVLRWLTCPSVLTGFNYNHWKQVFWKMHVRIIKICFSWTQSYVRAFFPNRLCGT